MMGTHQTQPSPSAIPAGTHANAQAERAEPAVVEPPLRRLGSRVRSGNRFSLGTLNIVAIMLGLLIWAAVTSNGLVGLPGPWEVLTRAVSMLASGQLINDIGASLARVLSGFILGAVLAIPVGFLMGWYPVARGLIEPYVQFFRMIPPLAIIPLAIVTMGIGELPKIFVIFLASFLSSVVAVYGGVISVDKTLINAARVLGARDGTIFLRVIIPASLPFIMVGLRIGLGSSWATVVAAELIAAQSGLGFRMQQAQLYYELPTIFVSLITIGILGLAMDRVIIAAERRLTSWQERE
jgi:NitT/TauT family transport system permease protein